MIYPQFVFIFLERWRLINDNKHSTASTGLTKGHTDLKVHDYIHLWQKKKKKVHCVQAGVCLRQRHRGQKFSTAAEVANYCTSLDMLYINSRKSVSTLQM